MFEKLHTPEEAFNWQLGAALTMEREIVEMLDDLIEESQQEALQQTFRSHQAQTRGHVENLEEVFRLMGWEVDDSPCPAIKAIEKEGKANIKKSDDAVVDSVILEGAMETEHHEIAVYENLIIQAQALGREDVAELFQRNIDDERAALEKVTTLARQVASSAPREPASAS
ncbi:MAG TPA: ferritin-like domain-containing protein [Solirubrobacteraceae bacterium]|nr:ferritin-like domain-containing protein [Solirubrobacteraceae bacterium]